MDNPDYTTWMCQSGYHGTPERRYVDNPQGWSGMYEGHCAGTSFSVWTGKTEDCPCSCHTQSGRTPVSEIPLIKALLDPDNA